MQKAYVLNGMDYELHRALWFQFFLSAVSVDAARRSSKWRGRLSWSMRQRADEWEGEDMGGTEDGRWSGVSIKGTELISSGVQ